MRRSNTNVIPRSRKHSETDTTDVITNKRRKTTNVVRRHKDAEHVARNTSPAEADSQQSNISQNAVTTNQTEAPEVQNNNNSPSLKISAAIAGIPVDSQTAELLSAPPISSEPTLPTAIATTVLRPVDLSSGETDDSGNSEESEEHNTQSEPSEEELLVTDQTSTVLPVKWFFDFKYSVIGGFLIFLLAIYVMQFVEQTEFKTAKVKLIDTDPLKNKTLTKPVSESVTSDANASLEEVVRKVVAEMVQDGSTSKDREREILTRIQETESQILEKVGKSLQELAALMNNNVAKKSDAVESQLQKLKDDISSTMKQVHADNIVLQKKITALDGTMSQQSSKTVKLEEALELLQKVLETRLSKFEAHQNSQKEHSAEFAGSSEELATFKEEIVEMMRNEINLLYADKINKTDFALRSLGAHIIDHTPNYKWAVKTSTPYDVGFAKLHIPTTLHKENPPENILEPDTTLGNCWAFSGSKGFVTIKLPMLVHPESFTLDHVVSSIDPDVSSAPKEVQVYATTDTNNNLAPFKQVGTYEFDVNGHSIQSFNVTTPLDSEEAFNIFSLRVLSNHGNSRFTCVYRFRVHGKLVRK